MDYACSVELEYNLDLIWLHTFRVKCLVMYIGGMPKKKQWMNWGLNLQVIQYVCASLFVSLDLDQSSLISVYTHIFTTSTFQSVWCICYHLITLNGHICFLLRNLRSTLGSACLSPRAGHASGCVGFTDRKKTTNKKKRLIKRPHTHTSDRDSFTSPSWSLVFTELRAVTSEQLPAPISLNWNSPQHRSWMSPCRSSQLKAWKYSAVVSSETRQKRTRGLVSRCPSPEDSALRQKEGSVAAEGLVFGAAASLAPVVRRSVEGKGSAPPTGGLQRLWTGNDTYCC